MHSDPPAGEATAAGAPAAEHRGAALPAGIAQALALGPVLILCDRADWTPSYVSPNVSRILGYRPDQVVGSPRFSPSTSTRTTRHPCLPRGTRPRRCARPR